MPEEGQDVIVKESGWANGYARQKETDGEDSGGGGGGRHRHRHRQSPGKVRDEGGEGKQNWRGRAERTQQRKGRERQGE